MGLAKTFLAIGIAVIFVVFIAYAVDVIYEKPDYESSGCYDKFDCYNLTSVCDQEVVDVNLGEAQPVIKKEDNCYSRVIESEEYKNCQDNVEKCEEEFKLSSETYHHAKISFWILLVIGLGAIIAGMMLTGYQGIGAGLIGGGVLVILWSLIYTHEYWLTLSKYFKLLSLAIVLFVLIYLGYKKVDVNQSKNKSERKSKAKK